MTNILTRGAERDAPRLDQGQLFGPPRRGSFDERRDEFLRALRAKSSGRYKRYLGSPLRYAGGKSLAVGLVVERLPRGLRSLVSPFIGGGSVEVACAVELGVRVKGYDVFDILCNYWQVQLRSPGTLRDALEELAPNRRTYSKVKERLQRHWRREGAPLERVDLAACYYFNFNLSYGPGFLGWPSDIYMDEAKYEAMLDKILNFSAPAMSVECAAFEDSIPRHRDEFLYCDPPYMLGKDTSVFRGMYPSGSFPIHHEGFDHRRLRDLLEKHRGGYLLSYNDCPAIREWYSDCEISEPSWQYTMGQGETRIGKGRPHGSHVKESHELFIHRPPP